MEIEAKGNQVRNPVTKQSFGQRATGLRDVIRRGRNLLRPPDGYPGVQLTWKRRLNLYLVRFQEWRGSTRLLGSPLILTLETGNSCNLRCPFCFTGAGETGRKRSMLSLPLYQSLMDEMGDRLFMVELYNWGEPLLNKDIEEMIRIADGKGISTFISSNMSLVPPHFNAERAESIVRSGLDVLGCSIDGATQEVYEQYRVKGNLSAVLNNVRLINEAKVRLGSSTPLMVWEYHVFPHNRHEIEHARAMAAELGMTYSVNKGWIPGEDWGRGEYEFLGAGRARRCNFLWERAVVQNDGGVAACCGSFYREDDFGGVGAGESGLDASSFRKVWNNQKFREARGLFGKDGRGEAGAGSLCYECPATLMWDEYLAHVRAGGAPMTYTSRFSSNDGFNFFLGRAPEGTDRGDLPAAREIIPLTRVDSSPVTPDKLI